VSKLRRFAPSTLFDKQIRKINQLNGQVSAAREEATVTVGRIEDHVQPPGSAQ
jgi:hypothetical protein